MTSGSTALSVGSSRVTSVLDILILGICLAARDLCIPFPSLQKQEFLGAQRMQRFCLMRCKPSQQEIGGMLLPKK